MNLLFLAPLASRKRAVAVETRRALDDGHTVVLIAEAGVNREGWDLDPRVDVEWLSANELNAPEARSTALLRLPLGLLRLVGRGPLRRLADKAAGRWKRHVTGPRDKRRKRETDAMREAHRLDRVRARLAAAEPDWLVLCESAAIELATEFVPDLLAARPGLRATYAYEPLPGGDVER
ncbi:hypothetical protein O1R50_02710 [Glycomyces luteolus]|uniref:Uncharacterized protein n=1 Tax=Glycomyces luteolus TaxID=2670330 RepID=A0A9X3SQ39_9ACTN|nr:hypothetical protein [Glycomyces luteolus]MDA1358514.1 hypothetical protein [Glycomyces luteolus]